MRFAYMGESGLDSGAFAVAASVLVRADRQLKAVEQHLAALLAAFALPEERETFAFDARRLIDGGSEEFKNRYPLEKQHALLLDLCEIPRRFRMPVCMHAADAAELAQKQPQLAGDRLHSAAALAASTGCAQAIDKYLRRFGEDEEIAALLWEQGGTDGGRAVANLERIAGAAMFTARTGGSVLQVADALASVFGRIMNRSQVEEKFFAPLRDQVVSAHFLFDDAVRQRWGGD